MHKSRKVYYYPFDFELTLMAPQSRCWCFTTQVTDANIDEILLHLQLLSEDESVKYLVVGRERAPTTGQRHLQGYVVFSARKRFTTVQGLLPPSHLECARGTATQNRSYCIKDGDFDEYGTFPSNAQGKRSDWEELRDWLKSLDDRPRESDFIDLFPALWGRYRRGVLAMADVIFPTPTLRDGTLRGWQEDLQSYLGETPDDRSIRFYVDPEGGHGKSWFCQYLLTRLDGVQVLGPGKRDDLAHVIDVRTKVFLINVPRGNMEFLNYGLLESLKDRMVFSPKYESCMKILLYEPHVIVFTNEEPDMEKMTADRYDIHHL